MNSAPSDPIDAETYARLEEMEALGARGVVSRVLAAFLKEGPVHADRIEQAVRAGAVEEVIQAAHGLKSSSANVGALRLARLCQEAEDLGRGADLGPTASSVVHALRLEFEAVRQALATRLEARGRPA